MSSTHAVHLSKAPIKREVTLITLDSDDDEKKPEEKKVKTEEEEPMPDAPPTPSTRMPGTPLSAGDADALREQLAKSENLRELACRSARITERRAKYAEEQLENKHEELQVAKRNAEDSRKKELEFNKKTEEWARQKSEWEEEKDILTTANNLYQDRELEWQNESSKLKETNVNLTGKQDISNGINHKLTLENSALKKELEDLKAKRGNKSSAELEREIVALKAAMKRNEEVATARTEELKEKLKEAQEKSEIDRTRIGDLTAKVAEYEGGKAPPMQKKYLHDRAHTVNLFRLMRPNIASAVPIDKAVAAIRAKMDHCRIYKEYKEFVNYGKNNSLECAACESKVFKHSFIDHFLSPDHIKKVHAHGGAVSLHAKLFWENALQEAAVAAAAAAAAEAGAALAALPTKQQPAESGENSEREDEY